MEMRVVETALGEVPIWTRGDPGGPLVVVINGAFPTAVDDLHWLDVPGAQMAFLHLPGFHSRRLTEISVATFTAGHAEALRKAFGRPFVAAGVSTGALVAMGLRDATRVLAVEPFFATGQLWPLFKVFSSHAEHGVWPEAAQRWADAIFGRSMNGRDYHGVLTGLRAPTEVLVGDLPLMPERPVDRMPSLCSDSDRHALAEHPLITVETTPGGHEIDRRAIQDALARVSGASVLARPSPTPRRQAYHR